MISLKLQEMVVNELRLWAVPLKYTGFTFRSAEETWKSNGGTSAEKAVLLVTILKAAGIPAEPVIVIRKSLYDEKIGSLLDIDDIIVRVMPKNADILYLSVSSINPQNLIKGLPDRVLVAFGTEGKTEVIRTKETESRIALNATLQVDEKKQMNGEVKLTFTNNSDPWFTLLRDNAKGKSYFGGFSSSDLKELKVITTGPEEGYLKYSVVKEKPFHKDTNLYTFSLPYATNGIDSWGIKLLPKTRITPVEIPSPVEEAYDFTFNLPEGMKLFTPEKKTDIKNKAGELYFEVKKSGNEVLVIKRIKLVKSIIDPSAYADFKALMDNWNLSRNKEIIFTE
jgi:hypothetical protein